MATPSAPALPRTPAPTGRPSLETSDRHRRGRRRPIEGLATPSPTAEDPHRRAGQVSRVLMVKVIDDPSIGSISWSDRGLWRHPSAPALPRTPAPTGRPSPRPSRMTDGEVVDDHDGHHQESGLVGGRALDRLHEIADRGLWRHPVHRHCRGPLHRRAGQVRDHDRTGRRRRPHLHHQDQGWEQVGSHSPSIGSMK